MKEQKQKRVSLWRRMRDRYDCAMGHCLRGEMQGCRQLTLQGCEKILEYGNRRIRLALRDPDACEITVLGEELICLSYHPDAVVVEGRIYHIVLGREDRTCEEDVCGLSM